MNKQREIIVTVTYNDLGIIVDTKAEERKKGKWLQNKDDSAGCGYFICSECKRDFYDTWNFCPECGADMRGESDEDHHG